MKNKYTILMIDDDEDDRLLFRQAVKDLDPDLESYEIDNCPSALEWLKLNERLPDIIFLDLNMPIMHGFECLEIIKQNNIWANVPVIIYSTSGYFSDIEKAKELGASGYLKKPDDFDELGTKLKSLIKHNFKFDKEYLIME